MSTDYREHLISAQLVQELVTLYEQKNYAAVNAGRPSATPDSKEFWFPLEVIEDYIAYIKDEASKKGYTNLGIKIKMAQYPEDRIVGPLQKPNTKGYQTVCLVPTADSGTSVPGQSAGKPEAQGISAMNFGTMTPP